MPWLVAAKMMRVGASAASPSRAREGREYYADYHGCVPVQAMAGISRAMRERGLTFAEAYRLLLGAGAIVHVGPGDPLVAPEPTPVPRRTKRRPGG